MLAVRGDLEDFGDSGEAIFLPSISWALTT